MRLLADPLRWRLLGHLARSDSRVRELVAVVDEPQNLVSYHLQQLRAAGLVTTRRSSFDARESYYHLDLARCAELLTAAAAAIHPALQAGPMRASSVAPVGSPVRVLFLCTGNSARSPMAAALLRHHAQGRVEALSAGSHPKPLQPVAAQVMWNRYGIDLAGHSPTHLGSLTGQRFDYVVSLCDKVRELCPDVPEGTEAIHWSIPDPAAAVTGGEQDADAAYAQIAADLDTRIRYLLPALTSGGSHG